MNLEFEWDDTKLTVVYRGRGERIRIISARRATKYEEDIPLGTLRDWEQGRREPDQPARAFLTVIARDPEGVKRALQATPDQ
jgi:hypothetical protein